MNKGINLQIEEFKSNIAKLINESNMPIALTEMVIGTILQEIHMVKVQQVEKEKQEFENAEKDEKKPSNE